MDNYERNHIAILIECCSPVTKQNKNAAAYQLHRKSMYIVGRYFYITDQ